MRPGKDPHASLPPLSIHAWLRWAAVERLLGGRNVESILEIGAGQGSFGALLARRASYLGVDLDETAVATGRERFARYGLDPALLVHGGFEQLGGREFDLVCAFEVLEHFEDDGATLARWRPFVAPGGALLLSVPAGPHRFATADAKAGHFRRYSRDGLAKLLRDVGFVDPRVLTYGFPIGYALEHTRNLLARRQLRRRLSYDERTLASGRWLQPSPRIAGLTRAAAAPFVLAQQPFLAGERGTGLVALATRGG